MRKTNIFLIILFILLLITPVFATDNWTIEDLTDSEYHGSPYNATIHITADNMNISINTPLLILSPIASSYMMGNLVYWDSGLPTEVGEYYNVQSSIDENNHLEFTADIPLSCEQNVIYYGMGGGGNLNVYRDTHLDDNICIINSAMIDRETEEPPNYKAGGIYFMRVWINSDISGYSHNENYWSYWEESIVPTIYFYSDEGGEEPLIAKKSQEVTIKGSNSDIKINVEPIQEKNTGKVTLTGINKDEKILPVQTIQPSYVVNGVNGISEVNTFSFTIMNEGTADGYTYFEGYVTIPFNAMNGSYRMDICNQNDCYEFSNSLTVSDGDYPLDLSTRIVDGSFEREGLINTGIVNNPFYLDSNKNRYGDIIIRGSNAYITDEVAEDGYFSLHLGGELPLNPFGVDYPRLEFASQGLPNFTARGADTLTFYTYYINGIGNDELYIDMENATTNYDYTVNIDQNYGGWTKHTIPIEVIPIEESEYLDIGIRATDSAATEFLIDNIRLENSSEQNITPTPTPTNSNTGNITIIISNPNQEAFYAALLPYILFIIGIVCCIVGVTVPLFGLCACIIALIGIAQAFNNSFAMGLLFFVLLLAGIIESVTSLW